MAFFLRRATAFVIPAESKERQITTFLTIFLKKVENMQSFTPLSRLLDNGSVRQSLSGGRRLCQSSAEKKKPQFREENCAMALLVRGIERTAVSPVPFRIGTRFHCATGASPELGKSPVSRERDLSRHYCRPKIAHGRL